MISEKYPKLQPRKDLTNFTIENPEDKTQDIIEFLPSRLGELRPPNQTSGCSSKIRRYHKAYGMSE